MELKHVRLVWLKPWAPQFFFGTESGRGKFCGGDDFCRKCRQFRVCFHMIGVVSIVLWCVRRCVRVGNRVWILIGGVASLFRQGHRFLWS